MARAPCSMGGGGCGGRDEDGMHLLHGMPLQARGRDRGGQECRARRQSKSARHAVAGSAHGCTRGMSSTKHSRGLCGRGHWHAQRLGRLNVDEVGEGADSSKGRPGTCRGAAHVAWIVVEGVIWRLGVLQQCQHPVHALFISVVCWDPIFCHA